MITNFTLKNNKIVIKNVKIVVDYLYLSLLVIIQIKKVEMTKNIAITYI